VSEKEQNFIPQYSLLKIILIWAAVTFPIGVLGWIVAPIISRNIGNTGIGRTLAISLGLIWQFLLALILLYNENKKLGWKILKNNLRLKHPVFPGTNKTNKILWLVLIPAMGLTAFYQIVVAKYIIGVWTSVFPILSEPPLFSLSGYLGSPEGKAEMAGAWGTFILYAICAIFNTFLGEELLFRGLLLPRMHGVFGKTDWIANGVLFGIYHIHQPWGVLSTTVLAVFIFALPVKIFKCTWFSVILHSGQSVFFMITMLGMVLGLT
jgi:membrane protease YdiL (CAAX protease family)